jgi:sugar fermentation stimulation protein A
VSLGGPLAPADFVERPNRFLVRCRLAGGAGDRARRGAPGARGAESDPPGTVASGDVVEAHLPDPGRLEELLVPGRRLLLRPADGAGRRTAWTAVVVRTPEDDGWVSLDTTLPNRLVGKALRSGFMDELAGWELAGSEVALGASRLDFVLSRPSGPRMALEVKSVTLVVDGVGRFPDAVTARGARHVRELAEVAGRDGWAAGVLFVAQRSDVERVVADEEIDPEFARALDAAREAGVRCLARRCSVTPGSVRMGAAVPAG